ncbi:ubiquitin-protein ligase [Phytophthora cinnamomi]|uniref:ubiquitin-protein ligase n=1 Tax=Phytophthora cinnamomi TaxID=4785 RepID=UPI00355A1D41|nr:ubiquitin-protein ligase [Phytophthora cinnamomi]
MATAKRESVVKNFLDQRHPRKIGARKPSHPLRGHRHLVTLSEEELSRREQGWNDRFAVDPPPKSNKAPSPVHSPTYSTPPTPLTKESKIRNERVQYGKRGGKRIREPKKPSSGKLMPLGTLTKPPSESAQPTKEEKLRFKVLKAIDARETLLYQLSALILCTPVQESLFLPSRPTEPPTSTSAGRQQMRSRGGMALASTPLSRHGGNPGAMTNAREATKLAQQLATDLQVAGIQCVEGLVEWMLEAGAQAETPPPFLWRGRNYFLKMISDLDFAEAELQARGVNLDCFKKMNPLLIKPNQKLGRVLAAHSIIMEMVEFAKDMTPMELLALSGRMRDSSQKEREANDMKVDPPTKVNAANLGGLDSNDDPASHRNRERSSVNDQEPEHHDHESAADLVDLLDESLDFIRSSASREGGGSRTDPGSEAEHDDGGENNAKYSANDMLKPKDGYDPRSKTPGSHDVEAAGGDNQPDNSMDGDDTESGVPESELSKRADISDEDGDVEHVNNNSLTDGVLLGATEPETVGNANGLTPEHDKQSSARSDTSDNQSEYDNSFDAEAGDADIERETGAVITPAQPEDAVEAVDNDESAEVNESSTPDEEALPEADKSNDSLVVQDVPPTSPEKPLSSRTEESNPSDYDNSFDEEGDDANVGRTNAELEANELTPATDTLTMNSNVPPILGMQQGNHLTEPEKEEPAPEDDPQTISKRLVTELKRWAFLEDENRPTEVNARVCLAWCESRALTEALQSHSSVSGCIESSIISMLEQYGLAVPESPLESLLCSEVAQELDLTSHLVDECHAVVNDICFNVANAMQRSIQLKNSLVSEMDIIEVLEVAESVRQEYHDSTWGYLKIASALLIFLSASEHDAFTPQTKGRLAASPGLSRLVKVFYPYLVNHPREELSDNWNPVSSILAAMRLPVNQIHLLLDPMCKMLLLAVQLCSRSNQDSQDDDDFAVFPKVTVICDREDVLNSSVEYVWQHHLSSEKVTPNFLLFPFFKSSFGEKLVDGVKVEEGEGKGPLKEWFVLVGKQLASKWKQVPISKLLVEASSPQITASGNAVTIPGAAEVVCPGFQLEWETDEGETIRRVVNKALEDDIFLLDRGIPTHSLTPSQASQLRISKPNAAILEYVQGSESYWLNENTVHSRETRNVLIFVGWFFASAMTHFSSIQLRIHPLFFRLLLNPQHCVSLKEIELFDPQLFKSLSGMKDMKPSDFAEYLKFEGADENLSVEAYIAKVLEDKFGPTSGIGWQIDCARRGFTRVVTIEQLRRVGIAEGDLVESICGSVGGGGDDFAVNEVFRVAADSDFTCCQPLMDAFWQTVNSFEPPLKRKFIKFVTGVDTLPLAGTEFLRIELPFTAISAADHEKCLRMLPQAHTCDNTLELPHYWSALCWREQHNEHEANSKLEEELALLLGKKLRDAVEYSSGYGLDGTSAVGNVFADKTSTGDDNELAQEESYDSLGLPALSEGQGEADLPAESSQQSPRGSDHDVTGEEDEEAPAELDTHKPLAAARSPGPDESYDEYDWEEEDQSMS